MPSISVEVIAQFDKKKVPLTPYYSGNRVWIDLPPNKDMVFVLNFTRLNRFSKDLKVYAPRFSKVLAFMRTHATFFVLVYEI